MLLSEHFPSTPRTYGPLGNTVYGFYTYTCTERERGRKRQREGKGEGSNKSEIEPDQ